MLHGPKQTQVLAKRQRRQMTLPEVLLWQQLRRGGLGMRFRHQHPAGPYVLDFFCPRFKLAIEVDGEAHGRGDRPEKDIVRDRWIAAQGVRTLRIPAQEILRNLEGVVLHIIAAARGDYPSTACGGPPPLPGRNRERSTRAQRA